MRDEPWNGWTNDTNNYGYTQHIYTKDMVTIVLKIHNIKINIMIDTFHSQKHTIWFNNGEL